LQLALRYLQAPALEMAAELGRAAEENPFLELEEADDDLGFAHSPVPRGVVETWTEDTGTVRVYEPSAHETLLAELRLLCREPELFGPAENVIGCLDERGYLGLPVEEIAGELGIGLDRAERALALVQRLDPPGIGARDLRECWLLQLERRGEQDTVAYRTVRDGWASSERERAKRRGRRSAGCPLARAGSSRRIRSGRWCPTSGWSRGEIVTWCP
jgi:RNA polymerase sigma-54 factor